MFINDIVDIFDKDINVIVFADDLKILNINNTAADFVCLQNNTK